MLWRIKAVSLPMLKEVLGFNLVFSTIQTSLSVLYRETDANFSQSSPALSS